LGVSYLFIKIAVETIPPVTLIAIRVTGAALFLLLVLAWRGVNLPKDGQSWRMLFIQAVFNSHHSHRIERPSLLPENWVVLHPVQIRLLKYLGFISQQEGARCTDPR
jgi:hypothetical protein